MIKVKDKVAVFRKAVNRVYDSKKYKARRKDMNRYLDRFRGRFWKVGEYGHLGTDSEIFCNYFFSTIMTIAPLITDNRPIWYIRPRFFFLAKYFAIFAEVLEYLWDKLDLEMKFFKAILVAMIMRTGMWKVYWDPNKGELGEVAVDIVDPRNFVMAPGFDDPWEAPWCGTKSWRPLSWIRYRFPEKGKKVNAERDNGAIKEGAWDQQEDELVQSEGAWVYEIFVKDDAAVDAIETFVNEDNKEEERKVSKKKYPNGRFLTFTQDVTLEDKASEYRHGKAPYIPFYDYINPFEMDGMGEGDQIESMVLEFNLALKKMAEHVRRFTGVNVSVEAGAGIDPAQLKEDLVSGQDNVWSHATGSDPFKVVPFIPINQVVMDFMTALPKLIEEVSGVTDTSKGMVGKKQRQTAGEIATLVETSYTRTRQRVRNAEWSIKRALYLIADLGQQFYTEIRPYTLRKDDEMSFGEASNSKTFVDALLKPKSPQPSPEAMQNPITQQQQEEDPELAQNKQEWEDYIAFVEKFGEEDEVYSAFDLEVQTNSTLPMDRQTLGNLILRLFELGGADAEAVLEILRIPKKDEIVERLQKAKQAEQPAQQMPGQGAK